MEIGTSDALRRTLQGLLPAPLEPLGAPAMLARLTDLSGTVRLAETLRGPVHGTDADSVSDAVLRLSDAMYLFREVRQRTEWLRRSAADKLKRDQGYRQSEEARDEVFVVFSEVQAFSRPREKRIDKAARSFIGGYIDRIDGAVRTVRADLAIVRQDLGATLRGLGPQVALLEGLDDSLQKATVARTLVLYRKFGEALGARFAQEIHAQLIKLPKGIGEAEARALVRRWHEPGGLFHDYYELFDALLVLLVDLECQGLEVMVDSALELAVTEQQSASTLPPPPEVVAAEAAEEEAAEAETAIGEASEPLDEIAEAAFAALTETLHDDVDVQSDEDEETQDEVL